VFWSLSSTAWRAPDEEKSKLASRRASTCVCYKVCGKGASKFWKAALRFYWLYIKIFRLVYTLLMRLLCRQSLKCLKVHFFL